MIYTRRGLEPRTLRSVRARALSALAGLARQRPITSDDIDGFQIVADELWESQYSKCCYCEMRIVRSFHDVEHYRPKVRYWWLAFTWDNLLFACPLCNRTGKNDLFPLTVGDTPLQPLEPPPGRERPLLLDPAGTVNPVEHIEFVLEARPAQRGVPLQWWARERAGSVLGLSTIQVCDLNHPQKRELREAHVQGEVRRQVEALDRATRDDDPTDILREHRRALDMLAPSNGYVGLTYDAFRHFDATRGWALDWPPPSRIGLPARRAVRSRAR